MIGWRHQVPVHSPISAAALVAGARAAVARNGGPALAEARVIALLKERYSCRDVLLTDSGTAALTAALLGVLRDRAGAAVAMPAYGCYDLATAADGANAPVLLYDTDPRTLAPDLDQLRATLRQGAAAIVAVPLYGYPIDLGEVNRLAAEAGGGAVVIEDSAQVAGGTLHGRPAGTQSSLAVLSFGRGKGLTGGGGGALLAHDEAGERVLERVRGMWGKARRGWPELVTLTAQLLLERPSLYAIPAALPFLKLGQTIYREPRPLRRASAASASIIAATWTLAGREVEVRRRNAERLLVALRGQPGFQTVSAADDARPGYLRLPVVAAPPARRSATEPPARRLGIMPGYPRALCDLDRFRPRCMNRDAVFAGGRLLAERLCTLPTHGRLAGSDLTRLEQWIGAVGGGR